MLEEGLIDGVVRQLMSGKEAMVFVVRCGDETRCAKVYKEPERRSFRQAVRRPLHLLSSTPRTAAADQRRLVQSTIANPAAYQVRLTNPAPFHFRLG